MNDYLIHFMEIQLKDYKNNQRGMSVSCPGNQIPDKAR